MARTKDPSAATRKAWVTRRRNAEKKAGVRVPSQDSGGGGVVQQRGDFIAKASAHKAIGDLVSVARASEPWEVPGMERALGALEDGSRSVELPAGALDGIKEVIVIPQSRLGPERTDGRVAHGAYSGEMGTVLINSLPYSRNRHTPPEAAAKTLTHEIGHHVHLSRLSDGAVAEWARLSDGGRNCKISAYGRSSVAEHFAEAFSSFSRPHKVPLTPAEIEVEEFARGVEKRMAAAGEPVAPLPPSPRSLLATVGARTWLKAVEPKAHAFMERLWTDGSMWLPDGVAKYDPRRGGRAA